jgi:hypothetical protein
MRVFSGESIIEEYQIYNDFISYNRDTTANYDFQFAIKINVDGTSRVNLTDFYLNQN